MKDEQREDGLFLSSFRWPHQGDLPFQRAVSGWDNAQVAKRVDERLVMMMDGYKRGADLMVERATTDRFDRDALVYPILFNYRQYIELSLKFIIATYGPTVGIEANWSTHALEKLWQCFTDVLAAYNVDDSSGADAAVAQVVEQFVKLDPGSFSNRYPVDTKGKPIPVAHEQLDLAALADVMQGVDGYFNGCDGYLDHLSSAAP